MKLSEKEKIAELCVKNNIDLLDIKSIQHFNLEQKKYDLLVYLNNNVHEYITFAKGIKTKPWFLFLGQGFVRMALESRAIQ